MKNLRVWNRLDSNLERLFVYNGFHYDISCYWSELAYLLGTLWFGFCSLSREEGANGAFLEIGMFAENSAVPVVRVSPFGRRNAGVGMGCWLAYLCQ
jgi:hypothetical protein